MKENLEKKPADNLDIEALLNRLEKIVKDLESDKYSLEESLGLYEEGVTLYKKCRQELKNSESKIKVLTESLKEEDLDLGKGEA